MFKEINNIKHFIEQPSARIHVRAYAKLMNVTPATASKLLKEFAKKGMLKQEIIQNIHFYQLESNQLTKDLKVFYTIQKIRTIIPELNQTYGKPNIVLFGSAAKGEDVENSDIDLYIESEIDTTYKTKKLHRPLQLFVFQNTGQIPSKHLRQNIINGIVLQGEIQWNLGSVKKKDSYETSRQT